MRQCQQNLHLHWHASEVNGWNFNSAWTLPSGGDHRLETKVRVQSNAMKLWTMLIWRTKALWTLKVISMQRKPRDKRTLAPLCIYNIMPLSCQWTYQGPNALPSAYGMGKKKWIHSHHNIHEGSQHSPPPYGLPPFLVHFPRWRPRFDSSYLDDRGDRLTLLCPFRTQSLIVSFQVPELQ